MAADRGQWEFGPSRGEKRKEKTSAQGKPPPGARREFQEKGKKKNDKKSDRKSDKSILMGSGLSGVREEAREAYILRTVKRKPEKHKV